MRLNNKNNSFFTESAAFEEAMSSPTACLVRQKSHSDATTRLYALLAVDYSTNHRPFCKTQSWLAKCLGVCVRTVQRGLQWLQRLDLITTLAYSAKKIETGVYRTASSIVFLKRMQDVNFSAKQSLVTFNVALNERDLYIYNKSKEKAEEGDLEGARHAFIWAYTQEKELKHGKKFCRYIQNMRIRLLAHCRFPRILNILAYCEAAYRELVAKLGRWDVQAIEHVKHYAEKKQARERWRESKSAGERKDDARIYANERYSKSPYDNAPVLKEYVEPPKGEKASCMPQWLKEQIGKLRGN